MSIPRWTWPLLTGAGGALTAFAITKPEGAAPAVAVLAAAFFAATVAMACVRFLPAGAALAASAAAVVAAPLLVLGLAPHDVAALALVAAIVAIPQDVLGTPSAVPRTLAAIGALVLAPVTGLVSLAVLPWLERDRVGMALWLVAAIVVVARPLEANGPGRAASMLYLASAFLVARLLARPAEAHPFSSRAGARAAAALPAGALLVLILWRREDVVAQALTGALTAALGAVLLGVAAAVLALGTVVLFATKGAARLPTAAVLTSSALGVAFLGPVAAWAAIVPLLAIAGVGFRAVPRLISPSTPRPTEP